ncbi:MAG: hypothetical protein ACRYF3_10130 [Janthinobacterium lividum]
MSTIADRVGGQSRGDVLHMVLLALAGRLDDTALTTARALLAAGLEADAAGLVVDEAALRGTPLDPAEVAVLDLVVPEGSIRAAGLLVSQTSDVTAFTFSTPTSAPPADLKAFLPRLVVEHGIVAAWRAHRSQPGAPPRCVHLLEVSGTTVPHHVTGVVQALLASAGEEDPQVEVVRSGLRPPAYHRALREQGERLHPLPLSLARLFDGVDAEGNPEFAADHPVLEPSHAQRVLNHLRAAPSVLVSESAAVDVVGGGAARVPLGFRTDGTSVWCDAAAWYLDRYRLAPDPELLRSFADRATPVSAVAPGVLERALAVVFGGADPGF